MTPIALLRKLRHHVAAGHRAEIDAVLVAHTNDLAVIDVVGEDRWAKLTPAQRDVVRAFVAYRKEHGLPPTLVELAGALGVSKVTVFQHVGEIVRKQVLRKTSNISRGLELVKA